jgi:hypothetical protein
MIYYQVKLPFFSPHTATFLKTISDSKLPPADRNYIHVIQTWPNPNLHRTQGRGTGLRIAPLDPRVPELVGRTKVEFDNYFTHTSSTRK